MRVGNDIVEIKRVENLYAKTGIPEKIFTPDEIAHIKASGSDERIVERMAGKFASKEAVSKALGYGINEGINWLDIEVLADNRGMPIVTLKGKSKEIFEKNFKEISVSVAHSKDLAIATCILI